MKGDVNQTSSEKAELLSAFNSEQIPLKEQNKTAFTLTTQLMSKILSLSVQVYIEI